MLSETTKQYNSNRDYTGRAPLKNTLLELNTKKGKSIPNMKQQERKKDILIG